MDRFKFRVWTGHYYAEDFRFIMSMNGDLKQGTYVSGFDKPYQDCIVEQCTGLKDKNGNLIYEGDIVIEGGCKGVVKYGTFNCSCCDGVYGWYFDGLNGQTDIRCYEFCEVIGNIHEQKE